MGKVASSALCKALNHAGIPAVKAHFLGRGPVGTKLNAYLNPELNGFFAYHTYGQLIENIKHTRRLEDAKYAAEHGHADALKIKLISLSRDPLDWYHAEFVQNFDGYIKQIRAFCHERSVSCTRDTDCIAEFHNTMFRALADQDLGPILAPPYQPYPALEASLKSQGLTTLLPNAVNLFKPIFWFQHLFYEPTGIDLFSATGRQLGPGVLHYSNHYCEALVVKYELLHQATGVIADFVGCSSLKLPHANVSRNKPQYRVTRSAFAQLRIPPSVADTLYSSPYCKLFGYNRKLQF